jgi:transposase
MKMFVEVNAIYLHRDPVDFRQSINGLAVVVEQAMLLSPFADAVFVFCNKNRDKIKVLYWDQTGFCLWYKRLEKEQFQWPRRHPVGVMSLSAEQWQWLLQGYDISNMQAHQPLQFVSCVA